MKVTDRTRRALAYRRQRRKLTQAGYVHLEEPYWPLNRGGLWNHKIVDVIISSCGKQLYIKTAEKSGEGE